MKLGIGLLCVGLAAPAGAMIFPHLDYSAHLERGRPGMESFGTLVDEPPTDPPPGAPANVSYERTITPSMAAVIQTYDEQLAQGSFAEAVDTANELLQVVESELGAGHVEYAYALSDLGAAYHHVGEHQKALQPLRQSIKAIRSHRGLYSPVLVGPLAYLGIALQELERHDEALDNLTWAQHITHRHYGAMNLQQLKLVYAKAASMEALNELWETEQLLHFGLKLTRHNHGATAMESLPALYHLAEWLRAVGRFRPALSLYRDALIMLGGEDGADTPEMVPAMRGMAATFLLEQDVEVDRGLTLHRRIVDIVEDHPEAFSAAERVEAYADLGDWLILFEREEEAWAAYQQAWTIAQGDQSRDWARYFGEPRLIYAGPNLTVDFMGYRVIGKEVYYDFEFRVRTDGRPSHVKVLDSNLSTLTRTRAIGFLRLGKFRPALTDGEPITFDDQRIRRYYPTPAPEDYGQVIFNGGVGRVPMTRMERRWPGNR